VYQEKIYDLEEKIFRLERDLEARNLESQDLANIASVITSILDIESILAVTMEISIRRVAGEVGAILLREDGDLKVKVAWGVDSAFIANTKYKDNQDIASYCLALREPVIENDCGSVLEGNDNIMSFIAAPIISKNDSGGALVIFNKEGGDQFNGHDRQAIEMICRFASVAIENSRLLRESLEKQKLEQELELASQVQSTFLPRPVDIAGLSIAANYIPARQVGGDYYDLIPIGRRKLFFLLGDVTNKGVPAALVMTSVYSVVRAYVKSGGSIQVKEIMSHLNDVLCNDIIRERDMFITLIMAYIDLDTGMMEYCNGGHPPAFYYRAAKGDTIHLKPGGPLVGQFAGLQFRSTRIKVAPGDRIFCYTDGLIEAESRSGELYGLVRLEEFFKAGIMFDTNRFSRVVKEEIDRYSQGSRDESIDDYTTLVIDLNRKSGTGEKYEWTYVSDLKVLEEVYSDLGTVYRTHNIDHTIANPLTLMVSEAVTNAIIHAHKGNADKKIVLLVKVNATSITADIIDEGSGQGVEFMRNHEMNSDPLAESGRGLGLIKQLSDDVKFRRAADGGLSVKITMKIKTS